MELPSQSGLSSSRYADSEDDESITRAQIRKNNKPLLEKKRRARINSSLEQLKSLVLDALKKDSARYSKLEKADILEMTVKHLRELQKQQMAAAMTVDPTVVTKYQNGFGECAQEVQRYLGSIDGLSSEVRLRLMHHLSNCMNQVHHISSFAGLSLYSGVPCASPNQALPGLGQRSLLPFGGLAMTATDSTVPHMSPSSSYSSGDLSFSEVTYSPKSPKRDLPSRKFDNRENIAPLSPLSENSGNLNQQMRRFSLESSPCGDKNNNICAPAPKKRKMESQQELSDRNKTCQNRNNNQDLFNVDVKSESVWRPW